MITKPGKTTQNYGCGAVLEIGTDKDGKTIIKLGRTSKCRGCGADIAFIKTTAGKSMPVDPIEIRFTPAGGPNTYVMMNGTVIRGREPREGDTEQMIGYRSHFAKCPAADRFSGRNKK